MLNCAVILRNNSFYWGTLSLIYTSILLLKIAEHNAGIVNGNPYTYLAHTRTPCYIHPINILTVRILWYPEHGCWMSTCIATAIQGSIMHKKGRKFATLTPLSGPYFIHLYIRHIPSFYITYSFCYAYHFFLSPLLMLFFVQKLCNCVCARICYFMESYLRELISF